MNSVIEQTKQKQTHRYTEQNDGCQMGAGLGDWVTKLKGWRSTDWQLQNSHADVKCSAGNRVKIVVITMCGARWVLETWGEHIVKYLIV